MSAEITINYITKKLIIKIPFHIDWVNEFRDLRASTGLKAQWDKDSKTWTTTIEGTGALLSLTRKYFPQLKIKVTRADDHPELLSLLHVEALANSVYKDTLDQLRAKANPLDLHTDVH